MQNVMLQERPLPPPPPPPRVLPTDDNSTGAETEEGSTYLPPQEEAPRPRSLASHSNVTAALEIALNNPDMDLEEVLRIASGDDVSYS
jgi:hypothetical protein